MVEQENTGSRKITQAQKDKCNHTSLFICEPKTFISSKWKIKPQPSEPSDVGAREQLTAQVCS